MPNYVVSRAEIWTQRVSIMAANPEEARRLVADGHGEIFEDARFQDYHCDGDPWDVLNEDELGVEGED